VPVVSGTAAASELNAIATPHNPAQAAMTLTWFPSKITIASTPSFALIRFAVVDFWTTASIVSSAYGTRDTPHRIVSQW
jgi:hypothetical protein